MPRDDEERRRGGDGVVDLELDRDGVDEPVDEPLERGNINPPRPEDRRGLRPKSYEEPCAKPDRMMATAPIQSKPPPP
jgi:hypothetical protein